VRDALRRIGVEDSDSESTGSEAIIRTHGTKRAGDCHGTSQTHQAHDPVDEAYEYWGWADHTHEERLNHLYDRISTVRDALRRIGVEDSDSESTGSEAIIRTHGTKRAGDCHGTSQTHQAHDPVDEAYEYCGWADLTYDERVNQLIDRASKLRDKIHRTNEEVRTANRQARTRFQDNKNTRRETCRPGRPVFPTQVIVFHSAMKV